MMTAMRTLGRTALFTAATALSPLGAYAESPELPGVAASDIGIAGPVLMVADLDRSLRFYVDGLGLSVGSRLPGNPGPGATVLGSSGGQVPFLLLRQRDSRADPTRAVEVGDGLSRIMLTVRNAKAAEARLRAAGYAPTVSNARNIFFVKDPDGYSYEVMQLARAG
jgi:catechol 2,3-dioxygenase-like lactoylglutathione lyase family enzyme